MPATVSSRSRKADASLQNEPMSKKQRLDTAKSTSQPAQSLTKALFTNGAPNKLQAKSAKLQTSKAAHAVNDAKSTIGTTVGQRAVVQQEPVIEISSDSDSEESGEDDENEEDGEADVPVNEGDDDLKDADTDDLRPRQNGITHDEQVNGDNDVEMDADEDANDEPTFGELLSAAPIDVQNALQQGDQDDEASTSIALQPSSRQLGLSSTSLATVLSQALKTNDRSLLETCFATNDLAAVRSTIQRLPSAHVDALLHHIADKMHKRPGRAGNLMVWIQWSLVAHGGYLARRRDTVHKLGALNRVIRERAAGLQPLLALKGKLDMLAAQLELRREMMQAHRRELDDDDDVVIYVEGQEDDEAKTRAAAAGEDEDEEDDDDLNGQVDLDGLEADDSSDDSDDDASSDGLDVSDQGFSDQEADEDESASDLDDHDDDDEDEDESEAEVETISRNVDKGKKRKL